MAPDQTWWTELLQDDSVLAAMLSGLGIGIGSAAVAMMMGNKVRGLKKLIDRKNKEIETERGRNQRYYDALQALRTNEDEVWRLHAGKRPTDLDKRMAASPLTTITIANLKGGVGKTTIAANLAAYFDRQLSKRVLLVDLDFQGSLSNTASTAAQIPDAEGLADELIAGEISADEISRFAQPLRPALPNSALIPAFYDLQRKENQLMVRWILEPEAGDVRYTVANLLFSEAVEQKYDVVIFDCPPRLSTATIAALGASKHLLVPTGTDALSLDAVRTFVALMSQLKPDLNPSLNLAGVILSLTQGQELSPNERTRLNGLGNLASQWGTAVHIFDRNVPRTAAIANVAGRDFAYNTAAATKDLFNQLGAELCSRIGIESAPRMVAAQ